MRLDLPTFHTFSSIFSGLVFVELQKHPGQKVMTYTYNYLLKLIYNSKRLETAPNIQLQGLLKIYAASTKQRTTEPWMMDENERDPSVRCKVVITWSPVTFCISNGKNDKRAKHVSCKLQTYEQETVKGKE